MKFCISNSLNCILYLEWSGSEKEMSGWSLKKSGFIVLPRQVFLHTQIQKIKSTSSLASSSEKMQIYKYVQRIKFEWLISLSIVVCNTYYVYVQIHLSIIRAFMLFCINFHSGLILLSINNIARLRSHDRWKSLRSSESIFLTVLVNCSFVRRLLMVPIGLLPVHLCFRLFINI